MEEGGKRRWLQAVIGVDRQGSWNLVTLFIMQPARVRKLLEAGLLIARSG